jgi:hypothetical protein
MEALRTLLDAPLPNGFAGRAALLDRLELHTLGEPSPDLADRAAALQGRLEDLNERFVQRLRARIRAGAYTPAGLRRAMTRRAGDVGYDALDQLVAGLLDVGEVAPEQVQHEAEMVFYQPTPARVILDLAGRLEPDDVLYDLGSGLGHVVILAALLSGARARGIEIEPAYAAYAERAALALGVQRADFVTADARHAAFDDGTAFFLYTPFRGALLAQVLARLPRGARVFTHGPCSEEVRATAPWLGATAL